ncbi:hypothetical protein WDL1P1_00472 (plasmid) [Variovorax sp. WDL1]|nr:hypothetical protein APY03_0778 [Variovorax sp. WDL1]PNG50417.1 hypothetical protein CHC06_06041 [Variovorax sp. B2]PNG51290.1 hypothetical protein CHC07_05947 [Variovorax sp. B4]VTV17544.1 hypothetical protein WDL1P1_00472 [Variovorax sp. WDL1]
MDSCRSRGPLACTLVLALLPLPSLADVGGRSEADDTVKLYRVIERTAMPQGPIRSFHSQSVCEYAGQPLPGPNQALRATTIAAVGDDEEYLSVESYAKCALKDQQPYCFSVIHPGVWTWTEVSILDIAERREVVRSARFPENVFEPVLTALEALVLENIERRLQQQPTLHTDAGLTILYTSDDRRFARRQWLALERTFALRWAGHLNSLPPGEQRELPIYAFHYGCLAAGGSDYQVTSDPPGASIRLISDFDWQVCRARNADPWNPDKCAGWSILVQPSALLIGTYRYHATWPSGKESRNVFKVEYMKHEAGITLR